MYVSVSIHTCISWLCSLRGPGSNEVPLAASIPRAQILVSKYNSSKKGTRFLREEVDSRIGVENVKHKLSKLCVPENDMFDTEWGHIERTRD